MKSAVGKTDILRGLAGWLTAFQLVVLSMAIRIPLLHGVSDASSRSEVRQYNIRGFETLKACAPWIKTPEEGKQNNASVCNPQIRVPPLFETGVDSSSCTDGSSYGSMDAHVHPQPRDTYARVHVHIYICIYVYTWTNCRAVNSCTETRRSLRHLPVPFPCILASFFFRLLDQPDYSSGYLSADIVFSPDSALRCGTGRVTWVTSKPGFLVAGNDVSRSWTVCWRSFCSVEDRRAAFREFERDVGELSFKMNY